MRGYGYTRGQALAEPVLSFFALLHALPKLLAEEDIRALMVAGVGANPGEKGEAFRNLLDALSERAGQPAPGRQAPAGQRFVPGASPIATVAAPGSLRAEREAQLAKADEVKRAWLERLGRKPE